MGRRPLNKGEWAVRPRPGRYGKFRDLDVEVGSWMATVGAHLPRTRIRPPSKCAKELAIVAPMLSRAATLWHDAIRADDPTGMAVAGHDLIFGVLASCAAVGIPMRTTQRPVMDSIWSRIGDVVTTDVHGRPLAALGDGYQDPRRDVEVILSDYNWPPPLVPKPPRPPVPPAPPRCLVPAQARNFAPNPDGFQLPMTMDEALEWVRARRREREASELAAAEVAAELPAASPETPQQAGPPGQPGPRPGPQPDSQPDPSGPAS